MNSELQSGRVLYAVVGAQGAYSDHRWWVVAVYLDTTAYLDVGAEYTIHTMFLRAEVLRVGVHSINVASQGWIPP